MSKSNMSLALIAQSYVPKDKVDHGHIPNHSHDCDHDQANNNDVDVVEMEVMMKDDSESGKCGDGDIYTEFNGQTGNDNEITEAANVNVKCNGDGDIDDKFEQGGGDDDDGSHLMEMEGKRLEEKRRRKANVKKRNTPKANKAGAGAANSNISNHDESNNSETEVPKKKAKSRKKPNGLIKRGEGDEPGPSGEVKKIDMNMNKKWPFTQCKIVLQFDDVEDDANDKGGDDDEDGNGGTKELKSGWFQQGPSLVYYDRITAKGSRQLREELECAQRNKPKSYHPEYPGPVQLQNGMRRTRTEPANESDEELEKPVSSSKRLQETPSSPISPQRPRKRVTRVRRGSRQSPEKVLPVVDIDNPSPVTVFPAQTEDHQDEEKKAKELHEVDAVFKCPYCFKIFQMASGLIDHLENYDHKSKEYCHNRINGSSNTSNPNGVKLARQETLSKKEQENNNAQSSQSQSQSSSPNQVQSGKSNNLVCVICGENFSRIYDLDNHMNLHSGETPFKCPLCKEGFPDLASIDKHVSETHGNGKGISLLELLERSKKSRKSSPPIKKEDDSQIQSEDLSQLISPTSQVNGNGLIGLNGVNEGDAESDNEAITDETISDLDLDSVFVKITSANGQNRFKCLICDKIFAHRSRRRHMATHTGVKEYHCQICFKSFTQKENLIRHFRTHSGEKSNECEICQRGFAEKSSLKRHMLTHSEEREGFQCGVCSKILSCRDTLKTHLLSHAGAKPHNCDVCGKAFLEKGNLRRHMMIHTD